MEATIYLITNNINGKRYVGFTTWSVQRRWKKHCHDAKVGRNTFLCNAIRKHGSDSFFIKELAKCSLEDAKAEVENRYIEEYNTYCSNGCGYNMTFGGEGTVGHKHSEETRAKMSVSHTGVHQSEATKALLSVQRTGRGNPNFGKVFSEEYRKKIGESIKGAKNGRAKKYKVFLPCGEEIVVDDRKGFCESHGLNYWSVCAATRRGNSYKGYLFLEAKSSEI